MIKNFSDHAANERTFLAWVRTAIAVMAFGFLIEKFDVFLAIAGSSLTNHAFVLPGRDIGNIAGLVFIILGTGMVIVSALRFLTLARDIDRPELRLGTGSRLDMALAVLLALLGLAVFLYMSHALLAQL